MIGLSRSVVEDSGVGLSSRISFIRLLRLLLGLFLQDHFNTRPEKSSRGGSLDLVRYLAMENG